MLSISRPPLIHVPYTFVSYLPAPVSLNLSRTLIPDGRRVYHAAVLEPVSLYAAALPQKFRWEHRALPPVAGVSRLARVTAAKRHDL